MLEQLMTRRKLILLASVSSFLSGCSMFSSDRYSYQPVSYDNSEGSKVLRTAMSQYGAKYKYGKASPSEWVNTHIYINSWRIVLQNVEM